MEFRNGGMDREIFHGASIGTPIGMHHLLLSFQILRVMMRKVLNIQGRLVVGAELPALPTNPQIVPETSASVKNFSHQQ